MPEAAFSLSSTQIDYDIEKLFGDFRSRLIAPAIVYRVGRLFHFDDRYSNASVAALLFGILYGVFSLWSMSVNPSARFLDPSRALAVLIGSLSLATISTLNDNLTKRTGRILLLHADSAETVDDMWKWVGRFLSVRRQLLFSVPTGLLAAFSVWMIHDFASLKVRLPTCVLAFLAIGFASNGGYCALQIPTFSKVVERNKMKWKWLNPAGTPWVRTLSFGFNTLSAWEAVVGSLCMLALLRPSAVELPPVVAIFWLSITLLVVSWGFLYPQWYLYKAISKERARQLDELEPNLNIFAGHVLGLKEEDRKQLLLLLDLNTRLFAARDTAIDLKAVGGFVSSLVLPILTFVAGHSGLSLLRKLF